ncbi:uncharacterized protein FOMMEDRAFT_157217 [Fomitiporia mediterranea MF3/22]|uniref:uncharacterized protein n=1 Tax=Fomitiporia mediterranea (strain MF3/22) TaxID=694068 RepID=UPI0004409C18|nr:uncharacterized protein FOMMEDRAFT_157217 [Fomitiporia mediterranea MF3/22]EJD02032.1 hypothetical protein FOMMEDRAFT_157217 [Fomitiporia mediterranea MF3/22]
MSMYNHSQGTILFPTLRALSFPTHHSMLDITLDGPTPRAFTFPSAVNDTISNHESSGPPLTPPEPSPSTPSTSPSPFEPERPRGTPLQSSTATTQFTAPPFLRRGQSMQCACTDTASPAAQISSFNAAVLNPGAPLFLAAHRRGASISSLQVSTYANNPLPVASRPPNLSHKRKLCNPHNLTTLTVLIRNSTCRDERRPKRSDKDDIDRPTMHSCIPPLCRECRLRKNEAVAVVMAEGDPVARRQRQADLSKTISNK